MHGSQKHAGAGRRTHEQHIDLVGHEAQLTSDRQQNKCKLANLGHAEPNSKGSLRRKSEHVHYATDLQVPK